MRVKFDNVYKHIIFDFDGTLVDSTAVIMMMYNELAKKYNFTKVTEEEYKLLNNLPLKERFKALNVPIYKLLLLGKVGMDFKQGYRQHINSIHPIEEMKEVLEFLQRKGYVISVITSNSATNVTEFLDFQGLKGFHEIRSSNGLFGKHKTIMKYMKENGLKREDVIYIGDEQRDIAACRKCNIDIVAVSWGLDTKEVLLAAKPNYFVEQPREIIEILS